MGGPRHRAPALPELIVERLDGYTRPVWEDSTQDRLDIEGSRDATDLRISSITLPRVGLKLLLTFSLKLVKAGWTQDPVRWRRSRLRNHF